MLPLYVRHRIDGLEIHNLQKYVYQNVRHRIDGLESLIVALIVAVVVRHRIDGLEKTDPHL